MSQGSGQPYQGYPYVNPSFTDAPSVNAISANRWTNLPKTQFTTFRRRDDTAVTIEEGTRDDEQSPPRPSRINTKPPQTRPDSLDPVVYIDLPDINQEETHPVPATEEDDGNTEFVQETIFYDPFENRRIDLSRDNPVQSGVREDREETEERPRPSRPAYLDFQSPSGSSGSTLQNSIPSIMTKESNVYCRPTPEDDFNLSPIPISEFPEPPPAYSELDNTRPVVQQPRPAPEVVPPRTQVTVAPDVLPNASERKYIHCPYCGVRVHTLMVRQTGTVNHFVACLSMILCLFPICLIIYCCDCCKYKNHYCPTCNNLVGYEIPMLCSKMVHVKKE